jgi:hypothetical protein
MRYQGHFLIIGVVQTIARPRAWNSADYLAQYPHACEQDQPLLLARAGSASGPELAVVFAIAVCESSGV